MKRRNVKWYLLALGAVVCCCYFFLSAYAERRREAARARVETPESVRAYERLTRAASGQAEKLADSDAVPEEAVDAARKNMAAYERVAAMYEDLESESEEWDAIVLEFPDDQADWTEEHWARAEAFFTEHAGLMDAIRALAEMGGPFYPLEFYEGDAMEFPHLSVVPELSRLLGHEASLFAHQGEWDRLVANTTAQFQLANTLRAEPSILSQLTGFAIQDMAMRTTQYSCPPGKLTPEQYRPLITLADATKHRERYADAIRFDQISIAGDYDQIRSGSLWEMPRRYSRVKSYFYRSGLGQFLLDLEEPFFLEHIAHAADLAEHPYYENASAVTELLRQAEDPPFYREFFGYVGPLYPGQILIQADAEARSGLLELGLTVEQYRVVHGQYPEALDNVASMLDEMPVDPFTGEPYRYVPQGDNFSLYSVGRNLEDDGGRHHVSRLDIVWRGRYEE